jgi:hypothetical protein
VLKSLYIYFPPEYMAKEWEEVFFSGFASEKQEILTQTITTFFEIFEHFPPEL